MSSPLVSVIIPVFNRAHSILNAVNSVLAQDYSSIEVILVDDKSTDNSIQIINSIDDGRVKLVKHSENLGANAARNSGLKESKGEWIAFLDSDDTWDIYKLSKLMKLLLNKKEGFLIAYCGVKFVENSTITGEYIATKSGDLSNELLYKNIVGSASVPVMHKSLITKLNGFDESLKSAQDWDLWLRVALEEFHFGAIPEALVNYTIPTSKNQISNSPDAFLNGRLEFIKKYYKLYETNKHALSKVYSDMAFILLNRFQNNASARFYFLKSLRNNPSNIKPLTGFLRTYLPSSINKYF